MYKSNASWTKMFDSKDTHDSSEVAQTICDSLILDYSESTPCPTRGVCTKAWVTVGNAGTVICGYEEYCADFCNRQYGLCALARYQEFDETSEQYIERRVAAGYQAENIKLRKQVKSLEKQIELNIVSMKDTNRRLKRILIYTEEQSNENNTLINNKNSNTGTITAHLDPANPKEENRFCRKCVSDW